jgi:mRNA-degrading endonuclease toxin of MazEF toxin-antitoxin module
LEVAIGPGLQVAGAVLADQTRSVDFVARQMKFLGKVPPELINEVLARVATILEA